MLPFSRLNFGQIDAKVAKWVAHSPITVVFNVIVEQLARRAIRRLESCYMVA